MVKSMRVIGLERLEIERLRDRVGRLYVALQEATITDVPSEPGAWAPPVDVCETETSVFVRIEVPGIRPEQMRIGLTNSYLKVCGEKKKRTGRTRVLSHICSECSYGRFSRIVQLRWPIDVRAATAALADGLLVITLPKRADRRGEEYTVPIAEAAAD